VEHHPERQRGPCIVCYQRAWLTLLKEDRPSISSRATELFGSVMRLVSEEPIAPGVPVSLQTGDWLALGEVCHCRAEYSHYIVGVQLDQFAAGLRDLEVARRIWLDNGAPQERLFALHES
jgi:hypothetical protein